MLSCADQKYLFPESKTEKEYLEKKRWRPLSGVNYGWWVDSKKIFFGVTNHCSIDVLIDMFKKPFDKNKTDGGLFYMMEYFDVGYKLLRDLCQLTFEGSELSMNNPKVKS